MYSYRVQLSVNQHTIGQEREVLPIGLARFASMLGKVEPPYLSLNHFLDVFLWYATKTGKNRQQLASS